MREVLAEPREELQLHPLEGLAEASDGAELLLQWYARPGLFQGNEPGSEASESKLLYGARVPEVVDQVVAADPLESPVQEAVKRYGLPSGAQSLRL